MVINVHHAILHALSAQVHRLIARLAQQHSHLMEPHAFVQLELTSMSMNAPNAIQNALLVQVHQQLAQHALRHSH